MGIRISSLKTLYGYVIAFTCIGWVLVHLLYCFVWGSVIILESNSYVLVAEISLIAIGSFCLAWSVYRSIH
jgi:hypothetical protein